MCNLWYVFLYFLKLYLTFYLFVKNAVAIAPGPTCVPIVLPIVIIGSSDTFPAYSEELSAMYLLRSTSERPLYARQYGLSKLIPPFFSTNSISILLPFLEPRAFPNITTSPSSMAITGLIARSVPANATVGEILPPFSDTPGCQGGLSVLLSFFPVQ